MKHMQKSKLLYLKLVDNKLKKREIKGPCFYANFECNTILHMNLQLYSQPLQTGQLLSSLLNFPPYS